MAPPPPPPPRALPDDLIEVILLRFLPDEPACLFRASHVCKPWRRLISGAGFRHRYREFHRSPPILGFLGGTLAAVDTARFVPTSAFRSPLADLRHCCAVHAHHGRQAVCSCDAVGRSRRRMLRWWSGTPSRTSRRNRLSALGGGTRPVRTGTRRFSVPMPTAPATQNRVVDLKMLLQSNAILASPRVVGFANGIGVVFLRAGDMIFTLDLKTPNLKKVSEGKILYNALPYMSFYSPALGAAHRGEGPSVEGPSAGVSNP